MESDAARYARLDAEIRSHYQIDASIPLYLCLRPLPDLAPARYRLWGHRASTRLAAGLVSASDWVWGWLYLWDGPFWVIVLHRRILKLYQRARQLVRFF